MKTRKSYSGDIIKLKPNQVMVFGSNTEGRHGKGAALYARQHFGAKYNQAEGLQGQSYGIITKDLRKSQHPSRTPEQIKEQIEKLYKFATENQKKNFLCLIRMILKTLNAYSSKEMAEMFAAFEIPENIVFGEGFLRLVEDAKKII